MLRRSVLLPLSLLAVSCGSSTQEPQKPIPAPPPISATTPATTTATAGVVPPASTTPPPPCTLADGADACKAACDMGHVLSCRNLGLLIQQGKAGRQNKGRLRELFRKACDANDAEACDELASLTVEGAASAALHRKACDTGYMPACGHLAGLLLVNGEMGVIAETEADIKAAMALALKGCEGGHPNSCTILGGVYGKGKPVKKDHKLAKQYLERGCDKGDFLGCVAAATMYDRGWNGESPDKNHARALEQRAFTLVQAACAERMEACEYLFEYHGSGFGTKYDYVQATKVVQDGCNRGDLHLCVVLGIKKEQGRGITQDAIGAGDLFREACQDGEASGCYRLARLLATNSNYTRDEAKIAALLTQSCDLGFMESCMWLAMKHKVGDGVPEDMNKAVALRRLACSRRGHEACGQLALLLLGTEEHGIPRKEAEAEAIRTLTFGCEQVESGYECYQLAWMHDLGVGFPKNRARARALAQKGCDLDESAACQWVKNPAKGPRPAWVDFVQQPKK